VFDIDKWKEIWATLRSNRLRTFLTAFGVFWGILMLMAMLGFGSSIQAGSKKQMKGMATNLLFVWGQTTTEAYDGLPPGRAVRFNTDDIEILKRLPSIEWLAPRLQLGGWQSNFTVSHESKTSTYTVMADYPQLKHIIAFEYEAGRFINERDIKENRKIAVIGKNVVTQLFDEGEDPIGKYIKISGVYFQVVGITRTLRSGQNGDRDANTIFVPFTTMKTAFKMGDRVGFFAMTAKAGKFQTFFLVLQVVSWVVGGATLLAGVIGVSNIMLITVKERTKEIGVRKALGATPLSIISMVMKESIVLTAIAGLAGVAAGVFLLAGSEAIINAMPDSPLGPPNVSITTVLKAVAVLVVSGAFAGIMPASHAASIKPIEALRAE
jgi:putative ABC transport system permease protein